MEKANHQDGEIVPIAFQRTGGRFEQVRDDESNALLFQLSQAVDGNKPYLVVTPEYSLYSRPGEAEPIVINDSGIIESGQESVVKL